MPTQPSSEPGSSLPPGFSRLGDTTPVVEKKHRLPPWLVGLLIAAVFFAVILIGSRLLGFGDDPVVEEGLVLAGAWLRGREALTDSSPPR
jgi:hypothetical protein